MRTISCYKILLVLAAMTLMAACHSDAYEQELEGHQLIKFPIVLTSQQTGGAGEELVPPTCIYLWAVLNMTPEGQEAPTTYMFHRRIDNGSWDKMTPTGDGQDQPTLSLAMNIILDVGASKRFRIPSGENAAGDGSYTVGYVYALATKFDIDEFIPQDMTDSVRIDPQGMKHALQSLQDITLDLARLQELLADGELVDDMPQGESGFSQFISTLYSTPSALMLQYAKVISREDNFYLLQAAPNVQLQPCAAVVDCSWDLPEEKGSQLKSIKLHQLPSQLRVFDAKNNPKDKTYECIILSQTLGEGVNSLSPDSRYKGATSAYVLQPASGQIAYTLTTADGTRTDGVATRSQDNRYKIEIGK